MTETVHTADTDYHHDVNERRPADVPGSLKVNPPQVVHVQRAWTLGAQLTVAILIISLAAVTTLSLIFLGRASTRAALASSQAATDHGTVTRLSNELAAVKASIPASAPTYHLPAKVLHYGVCVSFSRDTGSGALVNVNLTTPVVQAGSYTCGQGSFVSVVPAP